MSIAQDNLFQACLESNVAEVASALAEGADVNAADHEGARPIHLLLATQSPSALRCACLEALLRSGLRLNLTNRKGLSGWGKMEGFAPEAETFLRVRGVQTALAQARRQEGLNQAWWEERAAAIKLGSLNARLPPPPGASLSRPPRF